jgi:hypothetical protein
MVPARERRVLHSLETDDGGRCVDVFVRADATHGFEEYRRDAEDGRGWFAIGGYGAEVYAGEADALAAALTHVPWLAGRLARG